MQDFNLRPEIMGFGSPIRAEVAVPTPPADQWKPYGKDFEVNGLGQLRTAFDYLPLSMPDVEMINRDKPALIPPPVPRPVINKGSEPRTIVGGAWDMDPFKPNGALEQLRDDINKKLARVAMYSLNPPMIVKARSAATLEMLNAAAMMDAQEVPQQGRAFWHAGMPHTDACQCDGCTGFQSAGCFTPTQAELQRPLSEILADAGKKAQAAAAPQHLDRIAELGSMIVSLANKHGKWVAKGVLDEFGAKNVREVRESQYAELKTRLQSELDIPF